MLHGSEALLLRFLNPAFRSVHFKAFLGSGCYVSVNITYEQQCDNVMLLAQCGGMVTTLCKTMIHWRTLYGQIGPSQVFYALSGSAPQAEII